MMRNKPIKHHTDGLLVLLLFGIFAACVLLVLLLGADAYRGLTERDRSAYDRRTTAQYIATKVRQGDAAGSVEVSGFDGQAGGEVLLLREAIDGTEYITRVYYHDGYIRELFSDAGAALSPEDGEKILEVGGLTFGWTVSGALEAEITYAQGEADRIVLALRSGEEGAA